MYFSLEICASGTKKVILHYVLRREKADLEKIFFIGKMCQRARRTPGTAEREASVAEMIASEARHARTRVHV